MFAKGSLKRLFYVIKTIIRNDKSTRASGKIFFSFFSLSLISQDFKVFQSLHPISKDFNEFNKIQWNFTEYLLMHCSSQNLNRLKIIWFLTHKKLTTLGPSCFPPFTLNNNFF